jgi:hypothetical protein
VIPAGTSIESAPDRRPGAVQRDFAAVSRHGLVIGIGTTAASAIRNNAMVPGTAERYEAGDASQKPGALLRHSGLANTIYGATILPSVTLSPARYARRDTLASQGPEFRVE